MRVNKFWLIHITTPSKWNWTKGVCGTLCPATTKSCQLFKHNSCTLQMSVDWIIQSLMVPNYLYVKMSQPIRGQGGHLVFSDRPKNTNLVEDVEILLPVKFRWIPFSGFWEVEKVSASQRPGRSSCFSDRPKKKKHKLCRGRRWDLVSCHV